MNPCQVGLNSTQEGLHGIDEDWVYPFAPQSASLAQTENVFNKTVTFIDVSSKTAFAPQYGKPQGAFRMIVRRRHSLLLQKEPKVLHFPAQKAYKLTRLIFPILVQANEAHKASIKHIPQKLRRSGFCG
jgi:hypothetical protein